MDEIEDEVCEWCGMSGYHPGCQAEMADWAEQVRVRLLQFTMGGSFGPDPSGSGMSFGEAVARLEQYLDYVPDFDAEAVIENKRWWYIPHCWIGMLGFVVDKSTGRVYKLGSGLGDLVQALTAYEQGRVPTGGRRDKGA